MDSRVSHVQQELLGKDYDGSLQGDQDAYMDRFMESFPLLSCIIERILQKSFQVDDK